MKGLAPRSSKSYLGWVRQLAEHYPDRHLPDLTSGEVLDFLLHLQTERSLAGSTVNQAVCAIRTFYRDHLDQRWKVWAKVKITRGDELPEVLTAAEVELLLSTFRKGLYRAFFTVVYQCGLRLSEALNLRPCDIKGQRKVLRLTVTEFIRRWLQHVLPKGFARIRHYGFASSAAVKTRLRIRAHLGELGEPLVQLPEQPAFACPHCGGDLVFLRELPRLQKLYPQRGPPGQPKLLPRRP